jgi:hypothetical protein
MTPVFLGRIQTRIFVAVVIGGLWTLFITPFLLINAPGQDGYQLAFTLPDGLFGDTYKLTFAALAVVTVFGCLVWEPIYHGAMQFRWEKDWPAFFNFWQVVPEGITTFLLLHVSWINPLPDIGPDKEQFVPVLAFTFLFVSTWIVTWLFANGPMKIFFLRWRFNGGQLV